jgi:hypothetical protein
MNRTILAATVLLALACSRSSDDEVGRRRLFSRDGAESTTPAAFDWSRPEAALALDAGEAARRLGSFDWSAAVVWTVTRDGEPPRQVHVAERHSLRHAASGEFEVVAELDPGEGESARSGRHEIYTGGTTYAKSEHAPFGGFRERPTDHGRDAARHRDESFAMARDVARLVGPGLRLEPAGEATVLGRPARRFTLLLARDAAPIEAAVVPLGRSTDDDTKRRLAFLEGRAPLAAEGELVADGATGVPLSVHLRATFGVAASSGAPKVRVDVELRTEMRALGSKVAAIAAPKGALPDERKPPGVADALEAAGLKKLGAPEAGTAPAEPPDEGG